MKASSASSSSSSSPACDPLLSRKRPRGGDGRKKIAMQKIASKEALQVCFSKRRKGLFKKVAELCILTDAKAAAVVFSPAGKPYSLGYPDVDSVLDHLLTTSSSSAYAAGEESLETVLAEMLMQEEARVGLPPPSPWWEAPTDNMGTEELRRMHQSLGALKRSVVEELQRRSAAAPPCKGRFSLDSRWHAENG